MKRVVANLFSAAATSSETSQKAIVFLFSRKSSLFVLEQALVSSPSRLHSNSSRVFKLAKPRYSLVNCLVPLL